jgi:hypothetical protein
MKPSASKSATAQVSWTAFPFRDSSMAMDQAVPLFTGDKEIEFPGGYEDDDRIYVRQTQPLPMTVLGLFPRMNTFDK